MLTVLRGSHASATTYSLFSPRRTLNLDSSSFSLIDGAYTYGCRTSDARAGPAWGNAYLVQEGIRAVEEILKSLHCSCCIMMSEMKVVRIGTVSNNTNGYTRTLTVHIIQWVHAQLHKRAEEVQSWASVYQTRSSPDLTSSNPAFSLATSVSSRSRLRRPPLTCEARWPSVVSFCATSRFLASSWIFRLRSHLSSSAFVSSSRSNRPAVLKETPVEVRMTAIATATVARVAMPDMSKQSQATAARKVNSLCARNDHDQCHGEQNYGMGILTSRRRAPLGCST